MGLLSYAVIGTLNGVGRTVNQAARNGRKTMQAHQRSQFNYATSELKLIAKRYGIKITKVDYNWCVMEVPGFAPSTVSWQQATAYVGQHLDRIGGAR